MNLLCRLCINKTCLPNARCSTFSLLFAKQKKIKMRSDVEWKIRLRPLEPQTEKPTKLTSSHLMNFSPSWRAFETSTAPARTATVEPFPVWRGLCWADLDALSGRVDVKAAAVAVVNAEAAITPTDCFTHRKSYCCIVQSTSQALFHFFFLLMLLARKFSVSACCSLDAFKI